MKRHKLAVRFWDGSKAMFSIPQDELVLDIDALSIAVEEDTFKVVRTVLVEVK